MRPIMGRVGMDVKHGLGRARQNDSAYDDGEMGNGLRAAREKAKLSLDQAAAALGISARHRLPVRRVHRVAKRGISRSDTKRE